MRNFQIIIIIVLLFLLYHLKNKNKELLTFPYQLNNVNANNNVMTINKESKCGNLLFTKKKKIGDLN